MLISFLHYTHTHTHRGSTGKNNLHIFQTVTGIEKSISYFILYSSGLFVPAIFIIFTIRKKYDTKNVRMNI